MSVHVVLIPISVTAGTKWYYNAMFTLERVYDRELAGAIYVITGQIADCRFYQRNGVPEVPEPVVKLAPLPTETELLGGLIHLQMGGQERFVTTAVEFKKVKLPAEVTAHNQSVFAYLQALPDNNKVVVIEFN